MIKANVILDNINWEKYLKNPRNFIRKKIYILNKKSKMYKNKVLIFTLILSNSSKIKKLNSKFRKINKSTDILSFPFYDRKKLNYKIKKEKEIYLGDIIINLSKIKNKNNKIKFKKEFDKLWVHGMVHLFGYKHIKDKDFFTMHKVEKTYLKHLN